MPKKDGTPTAAEIRKAEDAELAKYAGGVDRYRPFECKAFVPFEMDSSVCNDCGETIDDHPAEMRPYNEALTRWFVRNAGIKNYYGGLDSDSRELLRDRKHLLDDCGIDYANTGEVEMQQDAEFNGTFTDTQLFISALGTTVYCKCGKYNFQSSRYSYRGSGLDLRLPEGFTLGQVIWQVIREGETA